LGSLVLGACSSYDLAPAYRIRRGFRRERLSYRATALNTRRLATWFAEQGVAKGDRVLVWAPNMPEYAVVLFGAWLAGVVIVPVDVRTRPDVLARLTAAARPVMAFRSRFQDAEFPPPVVQTLVLEELLPLISDRPPLESAPSVARDDLAEIIFTSGTTGTPKGAMITHGNLLSEISAMQRLIPLDERDRALSVLPLSHVLEQTIGFLLPFVSGTSVAYLQRTNAIAIRKTMQEEHTTCVVLVPELIRLMTARIEGRVRDEGKTRTWEVAHHLAPYLPVPLRRVLFRRVLKELGGALRVLGSGGAPLDPALAETWERMGVEVIQGYGLTETTAACTCNSHNARRLDSVGRPIPGLDVRIGDEDEILVRGPTVTPGYFEDPAKTADTIVDGWLHTGDVGRFDEDGFLHLTGRLAFRIVLPDGRNVYPEDVEQALNAHPLVKDSCVVRTGGPAGERVHAVLLTDSPDRAGDIVREVNRGLASHQQIAEYTAWSEPDLPRTAVLKPDRKRILAAVQQRRSNRLEAADGAVAEPASDPLANLIARTADVRPDHVRDDVEIGSDLGLDSLGRIELVSAIEGEMGRAVDEMAVGPATTVKQLRELVDAGEPRGAEVPRPRWLRTWWARLTGHGLQWLASRIQDVWIRVEVIHGDRARELPFPALLVFNYEGPYAPLLMLRAIPAHLRRRVAIAVDSRLWKGRERWQGALLSAAVQAFPFEKSGGAVRASLEETADWLDAGYAVIISPEGDPEHRGELLPFLEGTGLLAVEMRAPIVPFRIEGYWRAFEDDPPFPHLPVRRTRARVIVGDTLHIPPGTSYREATAMARRALIDTA
jgi:long-chain acyl-CoA synthetase